MKDRRGACRLYQTILDTFVLVCTSVVQMSATTIQTVLSEINRVKQVGRAQLYIYLRDLGIKPVGARQRPANYPADTTNRILTHLGISGAVVPVMPKAKAAGRDTPAALVSLPKLRRERAAAKRKASK